MSCSTDDFCKQEGSSESLLDHRLSSVLLYLQRIENKIKVLKITTLNANLYRHYYHSLRTPNYLV